MEPTFEPGRDREIDRKTELRSEDAAEERAQIPYQVKLDVFEGPLDLLLHLIRKSEVDIYNIPIATITGQYLATLDLMRTLNLDVAGDFVLMAATLAYIKSRMLLPPREEEEDEDDPRVDLVRQLLEYERFKDAAEKLEARPQLNREVFLRGAEVADTEVPPEEEQLAEISVFALLDAFRRVWERAPSESFHEITVEKITLREKIHDLLERLESVDSLTFEELLEGADSRHALVITFLAMLELTRLRIIRIFQVLHFGTIRVEKAISTLPEDRDAIARGLDVEAEQNGEGADTDVAASPGEGAGEVAPETAEAVTADKEVATSEPEEDASFPEQPAETAAAENTTIDDEPGPDPAEAPGQETDVRREGDDPEEGS